MPRCLTVSTPGRKVSRRITPAILALAAAFSPAWTQAADKSSPAPITAEQIMQENRTARGGTAAWQAVQSFTMVGEIYSGAEQKSGIQFLLQAKGPTKARMEVRFQGEKGVRVFDGSTAWKIAPFLQKYDEQPQAPQTATGKVGELDLGGPLLDYGAKGIHVDLEGSEEVDGHDAYKLRLTMRDGGVRHVWVDTRTFLDVKVESNPRVLNGRLHAVTTYYRDYKSVGGLMVPYLYETVVDGSPKTEKATIEAIEVNPRLDDNLFAAE